MSEEMQEQPQAFASFRVLNGEGNSTDCDLLFRNMAQLFSITSNRCDDGQVAQYDNVLCQLSEMVESEARAHVAQLLAPLDRAPGRVVVKLAHDQIEVARPLLEFSKVLSDDDLIEIVANLSEDHRVAVAGRKAMGERVGDAIVNHGAREAMLRLVQNTSSKMSASGLEALLTKAENDSEIVKDLRGRDDIDWGKVAEEFSEAGQRLVQKLSVANGKAVSRADVDRAAALALNKMRNRVGFNAQDWKLAWNQVKALNDRQQLDTKALARFGRFGYGHHVACSLTIMLSVPAEVFVKWLSTQDYTAVTVSLRAMGLDPEIVTDVFAALPWRDAPTEEDLSSVLKRLEALSYEEARGIFKLWRAHAFRKRATPSDQEAVA